MILVSIHVMRQVTAKNSTNDVNKPFNSSRPTFACVVQKHRLLNTDLFDLGEFMHITSVYNGVESKLNQYVCTYTRQAYVLFIRSNSQVVDRRTGSRDVARRGLGSSSLPKFLVSHLPQIEFRGHM